MGEVSNPFHYGSPAKGESFVDRQAELEDIVDRMLNGQNIILLSPRRYGKTSLLLEAIDRTKSRHGRSGYASLLMCTNHREVAETLLTAVLNGPLSWLTSQRQKFGQVLSRVRPTLSFGLDESGSLRANLSPGVADREWHHTITMVLRLLTDAGEGRRPVSLVLDEFQQVAEIDDSLPALFKVMADELRDVSLVFAGSKMHVMERIATGPGAPLLGMGEVISLGPIAEEVMATFLPRRSRSSDKSMSAAVARRIYQLVDGVPNDVQRLAYEAFLQAGEAVTEDVVQAALQSVVAHRALDYEETFTRLAPGQQRVLKALAREPRAALYSRDFMNEVDLANSGSVRRALEVLTDLELVTHRGPAWVVADAFFRTWLVAA